MKKAPKNFTNVGKMLWYTGAMKKINVSEHECRILHPLGFIAFVIVFATCIFLYGIKETTKYLKESFCLI